MGQFLQGHIKSTHLPGGQGGDMSIQCCYQKTTHVASGRHLLTPGLREGESAAAYDLPGLLILSVAHIRTSGWKLLAG